MTINELQIKVTNRLTAEGILANGNESIFNSERIMEVQGDSIMLVGPHKEAWVFLSATMNDDNVDLALNNYVSSVRSKSKEEVKRLVTINPAISVNLYLQNIAKLFEGTLTSKDITATPIGELIEDCSDKQ